MNFDEYNNDPKPLITKKTIVFLGSSLLFLAGITGIAFLMFEMLTKPDEIRKYTEIYFLSSLLMLLNSLIPILNFFKVKLKSPKHIFQVLIALDAVIVIDILFKFIF